MANNNKKHYYYKNRPRKQTPDGAQEQQIALFSSEQLQKSLSDLGISETTCALLEKNRIQTAADLVKRTEKDMYKVQGLNKKILFEVKDALKANDMFLRAESAQQKQKPQKQDAPKTDNKQKSDCLTDERAEKQNSQKPQKTDKPQKSEGVTHSKFGLAERATSGKTQQPKLQQKSQQKPQQGKAQNKNQRPEKLTEPLKAGEWRKVLKGGKWGYSDGFKIVIPTMYDEIFAFKEGLASVEIDEKCGYIDEQNNVVIPLEYDTAMSFSEGFAMVVKGEKCGYINKNNEIVIPFEYDAATPFENGEAKVKKDGKWGTLTLDGKVVWI